MRRSQYSASICKAVRCDEREALVVEEIMRLEYGTLDHLDARRFNALARESKVVLDEMRRVDPPTASWYEEYATR